jgi:hypothetical protein
MVNLFGRELMRTSHLSLERLEERRAPADLAVAIQAAFIAPAQAPLPAPSLTVGCGGPSAAIADGVAMELPQRGLDHAVPPVEEQLPSQGPLDALFLEVQA